jgi:hypothetical protein
MLQCSMEAFCALAMHGSSGAFAHHSAAVLEALVLCVLVVFCFSELSSHHAGAFAGLARIVAVFVLGTVFPSMAAGYAPGAAYGGCFTACFVCSSRVWLSQDLEVALAQLLLLLLLLL